MGWPSCRRLAVPQSIEIRIKLHCQRLNRALRPARQSPRRRNPTAECPVSDEIHQILAKVIQVPSVAIDLSQLGMTQFAEVGDLLN